MNRARIIESFAPGITLAGRSSCDDVRLMEAALVRLRDGSSEFDCGHAGTVLRFLALRLSRLPGTWVLNGSTRLLNRPQAALVEVLTQLGVHSRSEESRLILESGGWNASAVQVDGSASSQFLSGLVLNAWDLPAPLTIQLRTPLVSRAYFELTEKMVGYFGMQIDGGEDHWRIEAHQTPRVLPFAVEPDMSSCFAVVACAILGGQAIIENFPRESWQPDAVFRGLLNRMGVDWLQESSTLQVRRSENLAPLNLDVNNCPDLVPVLAVLLARANGESRLTGFEHLVHKESDRLHKAQELVTRLGRQCGLSGREFVIHGRAESFSARGDFDPDEDHRMAMAAQVANWGGASLNILNKDVVNKSFPEFWAIAGNP